MEKINNPTLFTITRFFPLTGITPLLITMRRRIDCARILMISFLLGILLIACSQEDEPVEEVAGRGTFELECTGGASFTASGTLEAELVHETNNTCLGCSPRETRLSLLFDAPEGQWTEFGFSIWNDGDTLQDKLYLIYPYEPGEYVNTDEFVTGNFENSEFRHPYGWNYVERGQIEFEFVAPNRARGWFHLVMPSNVPRDPEVEDLTISGTFDTPYTIRTVDH